jgi:predicted aconitase
MIEAPVTVNNGFRTQDILESTLSVYVEAQRLRQSLSTAQLSALLPPMNGITSGLAAIATAPAPNPQIQQAAAAAAAARKQAALAYAAQITAQARQALLAKTLRAEENEEELNRRRMEAARRRDLMIGLDIELIVPFVPHASELTGEPEWV